MNTAIVTVLAACVMALLAWAGGIVPAPVCLSAAMTCGMAALLGLRRPGAAPRPDEAAPFPWMELFALAIMTVTLATTVPLPPVLERLAGATRQAHHDAVRQALRDCTEAGLNADTVPWFALSRNRAGTLRALLLLATAFGSGMLASRLDRRGRLAWLAVLAVIGTTTAVAGHIGQWWRPQGDTLWWVFPIPHVLPGPVGGFVNRNHFGGFLATLVPVALGLAAWAWMAKRRLAAATVATAALLMFAAALMSLSRGAVLALVGGVALTLGLVLRGRSLRALFAVATIGALVAGAIALFPHPAVQERLKTLQNPGEELSTQTRLAEWRETLRVWPHYPWLGAGANALRAVYPQYRRTASGKWLVHAENMPVQWLAEGGIVALVLIAALSTTALLRIRSGPPILPEACRLGLTGGLFVAGLHALWDFAPLVPAVAAVLASLIGMLLPVPPPDPSRARRLLRAAPALLGLIVAAALSWRALPDLRRWDSPPALAAASIPDLQHALVQAPTSWHVWYYLGMAVTREGALRSDLRRCILGERLVTRAAGYDPNNYRLWYELGRLRLALMDYDGAETAFARATALRPWLVPPPIDRHGGRR